jgi:hypothetical protein
MRDSEGKENADIGVDEDASQVVPESKVIVAAARRRLRELLESPAAGTRRY